MVATYTSPANSAADAVRFLIGDTDTSDALLQDAEISWLLSENGNNTYSAAAHACETIAAKFSRLADTQVDDVRVSLSQRAKGYRSLAVELRGRIALTGAIPFCGGISEAAKQTQQDDTDRVPPIFTRDMHVVSPSGLFASQEDSEP